MVGRVISKRRASGWLLASLLLHALLLSSSAIRRHRTPDGARSVATAPADTQLDFELEVAPVVPDTGDALAPAARESEVARAGAAALRSSRVMIEEEAAAGEGGGDVGEGLVESAPPPAAASSASAPHLSLAQLGVDGANPFLDRGDPAAARAAKAARVKRRLDRALAQGLNDKDVALGRGAGGPVLRAFEAATYASNAPLNGRASFVLVIDSNGKLLSSVLGSASGDREAWARVARQTVQALAQRKLQVPRGKSVQLAIEVTSHLELPSGADPDVELSVQGVPLKKGGGPRSTKLDLSIFPFPAATVYGDPADIGARPRRMVHAHVVSEELL